jgi:hypothetical protein
MRSYTSLPQEHDFTNAVRETSALFDLEGGPMAYLRKRQAKTATHQSIFFENLIAGSNAFYLEPFNKNGKPIDPLLRVTHAFKHGMLAGNHVINFAQGGKYSTLTVNNFITQAVLLNLREERDRKHIGDELTEIGQNGLTNAGEAAIDGIREWAYKVTISPELAQIYTLGCGAIIRAGYATQKYANEEYMKYLAKDIEPQDDLEEIFDIDTGE